MSRQRKPSQEWRQYEHQIYEDLKRKAGPGSIVRFDQKRPGRFSKVERQIDVWVEGSFAGDVEDRVTAVVDCKYYTRKVDVKVVETFMGLVDDVGADLGILITSKGYTKAARRRAAVGRYKLHTVARVAVVAVDEWEAWDAAEFVWTDEDEEPPGYEGVGYDYSPYGPTGCEVTYTGSDKDGEVLSGEQVDWTTDVERRVVIAAMFEHHLGRPPDPDAVDGFLEEYRERLGEGFPFTSRLGRSTTWPPSEPVVPTGRGRDDGWLWPVGGGRG